MKSVCGKEFHLINHNNLCFHLRWFPLSIYLSISLSLFFYRKFLCFILQSVEMLSSSNLLHSSDDISLQFEGGKYKYCTHSRRLHFKCTWQRCLSLKMFLKINRLCVFLVCFFTFFFCVGLVSA